LYSFEVCILKYAYLIHIMIILILKVERKKISCKDTEVIKKYPTCLKDEKKISSSVENAQPPPSKI
jgi:hypothetical protein